MSFPETINEQIDLTVGSTQSSASDSREIYTLPVDTPGYAVVSLFLCNERTVEQEDAYEPIFYSIAVSEGSPSEQDYFVVNQHLGYLQTARIQGFVLGPGETLTVRSFVNNIPPSRMNIRAVVKEEENSEVTKAGLLNTVTISPGSMTELYVLDEGDHAACDIAVKNDHEQPLFFSLFTDDSGENMGDGVTFRIIRKQIPSRSTMIFDKIQINAGERIAGLTEETTLAPQAYIYGIEYTETPIQPPEVDPITDQTVEEDQTLEVQVVANDPDGDAPLEYVLDVSPTNMTIDSASGLISWTPTNADIGSHPVTVEVIKDVDLSTSVSFSVEVTEINAPPPPQDPVIDPIPDRNILDGATLQIQVNASDPDGTGTLTYSLDTAPPGMSIDSNGLITWATTASNIGSHPVTVVVTKDGTLSASESFNVTVIDSTPD